ncbi:hypothetical protein KVT40_007771 [Elsinoe batatas]|uniref:Uncharacterized protein n=1 Tax=Elsinoe batatas TaxID=2601811 RepID=A0A8K0PGL8_9PEZI|nr:hypothetical protein KVT40_007771 [Elsinoe batatas]
MAGDTKLPRDWNSRDFIKRDVGTWTFQEVRQVLKQDRHKHKPNAMFFAKFFNWTIGQPHEAFAAVAKLIHAAIRDIWEELEGKADLQGYLAYSNDGKAARFQLERNIISGRHAELHNAVMKGWSGTQKPAFFDQCAFSPSAYINLASAVQRLIAEGYTKEHRDKGLSHAKKPRIKTSTPTPEDEDPVLDAGEDGDSAFKMTLQKRKRFGIERDDSAAQEEGPPAKRTRSSVAGSVLRKTRGNDIDSSSEVTAGSSSRSVLKQSESRSDTVSTENAKTSTAPGVVSITKSSAVPTDRTGTTRATETDHDTHKVTSKKTNDTPAAGSIENPSNKKVKAPPLGSFSDDYTRECTGQKYVYTSGSWTAYKSQAATGQSPITHAESITTSTTRSAPASVPRYTIVSANNSMTNSTPAQVPRYIVASAEESIASFAPGDGSTSTTDTTHDPTTSFLPAEVPKYTIASLSDPAPDPNPMPYYTIPPIPSTDNTTDMTTNTATAKPPTPTPPLTHDNTFGLPPPLHPVSDPYSFLPSHPYLPLLSKTPVSYRLIITRINLDPSGAGLRSLSKTTLSNKDIMTDHATLDYDRLVDLVDLTDGEGIHVIDPLNWREVKGVRGNVELTMLAGAGAAQCRFRGRGVVMMWVYEREGEEGGEIGIRLVNGFEDMLGMDEAENGGWSFAGDGDWEDVEEVEEISEIGEAEEVEGVDEAAEAEKASRELGRVWAHGEGRWWWYTGVDNYGVAKA